MEMVAFYFVGIPMKRAFWPQRQIMIPTSSIKSIRERKARHKAAKSAENLVQVLPNALNWLCVSIKHALKKQGIKTLKPLISQGFQVSVSILVTQDGCGGRTRTYGLRVMSPTSYQLLHSAILNLRILVPVTGLEPVQYCYRGILSPLCLPVPPHRQTRYQLI